MEILHSEHIIRTQIVSPQGRVDAFSIKTLARRFDSLLDQGHAQFVVDLSNVSFLDSAGIAALVTLLKRARQMGGDVKLVWPQSETASRILKLTKFDRVFDMHSEAATALPH